MPATCICDYECLIEVQEIGAVFVDILTPELQNLSKLRTDGESSMADECLNTTQCITWSRARYVSYGKRFASRLRNVQIYCERAGMFKPNVHTASPLKS